MSYTEKLGSAIPASKIEDKMEVELGGRVIAHRGQARSTRLLGMVIANTDEGMLNKRINVPEGILAVDEKYILNQMTHSDASALSFGHTSGDNHLKVGKDCKAYAIAPGVVFVQMPGVLADKAPRFETGIKPLDHNEFDIPRSPCVHFNENEEVTIKDVSIGRSGRGGMGD
jgi:hypothetical protein